MDSVQRLFDRWSDIGRAEVMEKEHQRPVKMFLEKADMRGPFTFLDIGCGNGWVVRMVSGMDGCKKATGIDKSKKMIMNARSRILSKKEAYFVEDIEKWRTRRRFDRIFSMEVIYYTESPEMALGRIFNLLNPGGMFFCGTDFYADNRATAGWSERMDLRMHLLSRREWRGLFEDAGFEAKTTLIRDRADRKKWKREMGTLFVAGTKPPR